MSAITSEVVKVIRKIRSAMFSFMPKYNPRKLLCQVIVNNFPIL